MDCRDTAPLMNDIEDGGLKMLDVECMMKAQRIMCLKKYIEGYASPWKILLDYYLGDVGGKFILKCQFDTCKLSVSLAVFYKDCFDAWSLLIKTDVVTYGDIMNQVIWNNKKILSQGKSIYQPLFQLRHIVDMFWKEVLSWAARYGNDVKDISFPEVFFCKPNTSEDFVIINLILLVQIR